MDIYREHPNIKQALLDIDNEFENKWYNGLQNLRVLFDPRLLTNFYFDKILDTSANVKLVLQYINRQSFSPIKIQLWYPKYLEKERENYNIAILPEETFFIEGHKDLKPFPSKNKIKEYIISKKEKYSKRTKCIRQIKDAEEFLKNANFISDFNWLYKENYLELFDIYEKLRCHFLVTENLILLDNQKTIKEEFSCLVLSFQEFLREIELFLRGNGIYIGPPLYAYGLDAMTFYLMSGENFNKYQGFWANLQKIKRNQRMDEHFRAALFHRYVFLLFTKDQVAFQMQQAALVAKYEREKLHHHLASYYLNVFYIMLWGFLDNLAWVFNHLYNLGFTEGTKGMSKCTFTNGQFKKKLKPKNVKLFNVITSKAFLNWLEGISIKRHPVAHREPIYLSALYEKGKLEPISDKIVVTNHKGGRILYEPVEHMHYDFKKLHDFVKEIMDCFNQTS